MYVRKEKEKQKPQNNNHNVPLSLFEASRFPNLTSKQFSPLTDI